MLTFPYNFKPLCDLWSIPRVSLNLSLREYREYSIGVGWSVVCWLLVTGCWLTQRMSYVTYGESQTPSRVEQTALATQSVSFEVNTNVAHKLTANTVLN